MEERKLWKDHFGHFMSKRIPWFEIILIVVVMAAGLYAAFSDGQNLSWRWFVRDDAYYYFKVAQNISEGHGSTFDGINKTNGYHPLWMWICIPIFALARFDLVLPLRILLLVMSGLSVATAILLYRLIGKVFTPVIGAMAALFWAFNAEINNVVYRQGLETGIAAFFIALLVYKVYQFEVSWRENESTQKQIIEIAIIAVLTMFSRLDLVFLAGMIGLWVVFRGSLLRYYLPLDIAAIMALGLLSVITRVQISNYYDYTDQALLLVGTSLVIKIVCAFLFGLYSESILSKPIQVVKQVFLFTVTSAILVGGVMLAIQQLGVLKGSFARAVLLVDPVFTFFVFTINRLMYTGLRSQTTHETSTENPIHFFRDHWEKWLADGMRYYSIVLGALGIYMLWNTLTFGTASPVSGQIKRWWASRPGRPYGGATYDIPSFFGISYAGDANAWNPISRLIGHWAEGFRLWGLIDLWRYFLLLLLFAILFYLLLFIHRKKAKSTLTQLGIVPLFFSSWLQVLSYHTTGYSAYKDWYWITQFIIIVLTMSFIAGMFYQIVKKIPQVQLLTWGIAAYMGISLALPYWQIIKINMQYGEWAPDDPYMDIVPILEANTEPGSLIGFTGGGNPGYFVHDRTVVNMDGLINSYPYFQALQKGEAGEFLNEMGLDYVLASPAILNQQPYMGQFNDYMEATDIRYGGKLLMRYGKP